MQEAKPHTAGKYEVISPLHYDGRKYPIGSTVVLSDELARPLLECGTVQQAKPADPNKPWLVDKV